MKRLAGWQRGCWDCPRTKGCPRTRRRLATAGCRPWSRRWGSWSCCTSLDWSRCSLKTQHHQLGLEMHGSEEKGYYTPNVLIKSVFLIIFFILRIQLVHINKCIQHQGEKRVNTFHKSTHTCSLARPASGQQHHVTTSPHFCRWVPSTMYSCWWRGLMWISMQMMHYMIRGSPTYSQSKNLQECTAHSKLLHNLPQRGEEGEHRDVGGRIDDKNMYRRYLENKNKQWIQIYLNILNVKYISKPQKSSCLYFLLAGLVEYLHPHTPPFPLPLCRA